MQDSWLSNKADGSQSFADRKDMKNFFVMYDGPNGSLFISILLHNSEF